MNLTGGWNPKTKTTKNFKFGLVFFGFFFLRFFRFPFLFGILRVFSYLAIIDLSSKNLTDFRMEGKSRNVISFFQYKRCFYV